MSDLCGFCRGTPVINAERWTNPLARPYAPCPRCGIGGCDCDGASQCDGHCGAVFASSESRPEGAE